MDDLGLYLLFFIPPLLIGLGVQSWLKRTVAKHASEPVQSGLTGAEVARAILDRNGLSDVPIEPTGGAPLSDHYDPRSRIVRLSPTVFGERSVTATAVGAHEVGHAIQHARAYAPMRIRSAIFPAVAFSSNIWMILLLAGVFLQVAGLVVVAIVLYAVAVLFQLVTLPVEFDASRRAGKQLQELNLVGAGEGAGVKSVLNAAAMTYVAGALAAISQLLYFAMMFLGNRD